MTWLMSLSAVVALGATGVLIALVRQALWLMSTIPRLPRPNEATEGFIARVTDTVQPSPDRVAYYRLLVFEDSMVRGVGCRHVCETFGFQLPSCAMAGTWRTRPRA